MKTQARYPRSQGKHDDSGEDVAHERHSNERVTEHLSVTVREVRQTRIAQSREREAEESDANTGNDPVQPLRSSVSRKAPEKATHGSSAIAIQEQARRPNEHRKNSEPEAHLRLVDPTIAAGEEQNRPIAQRASPHGAEDAAQEGREIQQADANRPEVVGWQGEICRFRRGEDREPGEDRAVLDSGVGGCREGEEDPERLIRVPEDCLKGAFGRGRQR